MILYFRISINSAYQHMCVGMLNTCSIKLSNIYKLISKWTLISTILNKDQEMLKTTYIAITLGIVILIMAEKPCY